ncbi:unnamed protein product [Mytilus coruscus]|uniref:Uncharacterized protein n=1 Tax=Mytilus coruscus TaxID=42192 RepID=A0A6J8E2N9_MYTCO|nr:unnamed protein product [Mytilus coruscus]
MIFASFLEERNPFVEKEGRRNIETGVSATSDVNADRDKTLDSVYLNPWKRFIVAAHSIYEEKSEIFEYELSTQPSSMFDLFGFMSYVADGGSLIHEIHWKSRLNFGEICNRYIDSVKCYGTHSIVVEFDGYVSGPDTKDAMQRNLRESLGQNKNSNGIETKYASADADVLIAKTTVESAILHQTILLGEDTDLLVLLLYYYNFGSMHFIFKPNHDKKTKSKIWDINKTKGVLGQNMCKVLPIIHAISSCDTTSKLYGVGTIATLKKFIDRQILKERGEIFFKGSLVENIMNARKNYYVFVRRSSA